MVSEMDNIDFEEDGPFTVKIYGKKNKNDLVLAEKGLDMYLTLWEFKENFLRRKVHKGEHDYKSANEALEAVWKELHSFLDFHNVNLDEM